MNFTLSEAASVQIVLQRKIKGRRVGNRCSTRRRTGRRCTILRRALPAQTVAGTAGSEQRPAVVADPPPRARRLPGHARRDRRGRQQVGAAANLKIIR